jgi:magnesium chelatase family protein
VLGTVTTFAISGIESRRVTVEVDLRPGGLTNFSIVGLPDQAVREARERVRPALRNSGFDYPDGRLTANLAPADVRKAGPAFDLALAVGILIAEEALPPDAGRDAAVCGELSLGGELRPIRGVLAMALGARREGIARLIVPEASGPEAAIVEGVEVLAVPNLERLAALLRGEWTPQPARPSDRAEVPVAAPGPDLCDVRGQDDAKRALEIAAAGGHNVLMIGPPGAGKTMLARRVPGILPRPAFEEAIEITQIRSVVGLGDTSALATERPFRAPHHTISAAGLVGGGASPRPGEVTLAHRGVLFLDEIAEFSRHTLEALRQPMEAGRIAVTRAQRTLTFPCDFMLVAAANECPCARPDGECRCSEIDHRRYARRLSGPLLDRIDLVCHVSPPPAVALVSEGAQAETSDAVRERVMRARERQLARFGELAIGSNGSMDGPLTRRHARLDASGRDLLLDGHARMALTARGHDRVLRIARTIADLEGSGPIRAVHVAEALGYRLGAVTGLAA